VYPPAGFELHSGCSRFHQNFARLWVPAVTRRVGLGVEYAKVSQFDATAVCKGCTDCVEDHVDHHAGMRRCQVIFSCDLCHQFNAGHDAAPFVVLCDLCGDNVISRSVRLFGRGSGWNSPQLPHASLALASRGPPHHAQLCLWSTMFPPYLLSDNFGAMIEDFQGPITDFWMHHARSQQEPDKMR
jgi:hypothetical protein